MPLFSLFVGSSRVVSCLVWLFSFAKHQLAIQAPWLFLTSVSSCGGFVVAAVNGDERLGNVAGGMEKPLEFEHG